MTRTSSPDLHDLATRLSSVEDWLRDTCEVRHHEDMADAVLEAFHIVDSLADVADKLPPGLDVRAVLGVPR